MELWDVYDKDRKLVGKTHVRGVPMKKGEYHLVVFVWVFNSQGQVLLTKRAPEKQSYAGLWALTGGSAVAGENSLDAICRELFEETGICAEKEEFHLTESYRRTGDFCDIYFLRKDVEISQLTMQPGETCEARWASRRELEELIAQNEIAAPDVKRYQQLKDKLEGLLR